MGTANMRRPAAKKATAKIDKGIIAANGKKIRQGDQKIKAIGGAPNEPGSSNQLKKMVKRINQSATAKGQRTVKQDSSFKEFNDTRRSQGKTVGKKTR